MNQVLAFTLASAGVGVVAGAWFCVGSILTSSAKVAELAGTYWDYHPAQVQAYVEQTSQYSVGAPLLVFAFVLQVCAALAPSDASAPFLSVLNAPLVLLAVVGLVSWALSYVAYRALARVKGKRVHEILSAEVKANAP